MIQEQIEQAIEVLSGCKYVVVLTGAGISTESGIPDFRSPVSGLWAKVSPDDFTIEKFMSDPQILYQLGVDIFRVITEAQPTLHMKPLENWKAKAWSKCHHPEYRWPASEGRFKECI